MDDGIPGPRAERFFDRREVGQIERSRDGLVPCLLQRRQEARPDETALRSGHEHPPSRNHSGALDHLLLCDELHVRIHHAVHQFLEADFGLPAEFLASLG